MATTTTTTAEEQLAPRVGYRGKCLYKTGKCTNERALKTSGAPHNLCEEHRNRQNEHQRKLDAKNRTNRKEKRAKARTKQAPYIRNAKRQNQNQNQNQNAIQSTATSTIAGAAPAVHASTAQVVAEATAAHTAAAIAVAGQLHAQAQAAGLQQTAVPGAPRSHGEDSNETDSDADVKNEHDVAVAASTDNATEAEAHAKHAEDAAEATEGQTGATENATLTTALKPDKNSPSKKKLKTSHHTAAAAAAAAAAATTTTLTGALSDETAALVDGSYLPQAPQLSYPVYMKDFDGIVVPLPSYLEGNERIEFRSRVYQKVMDFISEEYVLRFANRLQKHPTSPHISIAASNSNSNSKPPPADGGEATASGDTRKDHPRKKADHVTTVKL